LHLPTKPCPKRLRAEAESLSSRERDLDTRQQRIDGEAEAARRLAEEAAAERSQLQQRAKLLTSEREQFRSWMRDAREEAATSIKVRDMHVYSLSHWLLMCSSLSGMGAFALMRHTPPPQSTGARGGHDRVASPARAQAGGN
jgi:hypothetical protein